MAAEILVSSCIACGRVDRLAECTGLCADRRYPLVDAAALEQLEAAVRALRAAAADLDAVLDGLDAAPATEDAAARHFAGLHADARAALRRLHADEPAVPADAAVIETWRCATCGRIEAPQPCLGVCIKQPAAMVEAGAYAEQRRAAKDAQASLDRSTGLVRLIASTTPRPGQARLTLERLRAARPARQGRAGPG